MEAPTDEESENMKFWTALKTANLTEEAYLISLLGPKHLSLHVAIPMTILYLAIFFTGILGNIITCMVIIKNSSMQNATNYYLFSLAISDLTLLALGLPNEVSVFWQQYPWVLGEGLCKIRAYVSEMSSYVSVLTIVAFSLERYLAICHPFQVNAMSGLKRPIRFIFGAWSIAMISAIPFAIYTKVNYVIYPPDSGIKSKNSAFCAMLLPDMPEFPLYEMSCLVFFFVPMVIIFILYVRMGLQIQNSTGRFLEPGVNQNSIHTESKQVQSRRSIIKMLSAVVIMFFICWAPFHTQRIFYVYGSNADYYPDLNEFLYIFSGFLYYFSTTVNPILYNVMSSRYRQAFKETLCCTSAYEKNGATNNISRINSSSERRSSNLRTSIRYTIDQAKEMFRLNMDGDGEVKRRENDLLHPDNSTAQALLSSKHSSLRMQSSNASSTSQNRFAESLSTASSIL